MADRFRDFAPGGVEIMDGDSVARTLDRRQPGWRQRSRRGETPAGVWYVGTDGKARVLLNSDRMTPDTPIHEILGHGFLRAARRGDLGKEARAMWDTGRSLIEADPDFMNRFHEATGHAYSDLKGDELLEEALSWAIGREGQAIWTRQVDPSLRARVRNWIAQVWRSMGRQIGTRRLDNSTTVEEFARRLNEDLRDRSGSGEFGEGRYNAVGDEGEIAFADENENELRDDQQEEAKAHPDLPNRQVPVSKTGAVSPELAEKMYRMAVDETLRRFRKLTGNEYPTNKTREEFGAAVSIAWNASTGRLSQVHFNNQDGEIPNDTSEVLQNRIQAVIDQKIEAHSKGEGSHSEIYAINELLNASPESSFSDFHVITLELKVKSRFLLIKSPCKHCQPILSGVNYLTNE